MDMSLCKQITIVPKKGAATVLSKMTSADALFYYLDEDYAYFVRLQNKFKDKIQLKTLSGLFDKTLQEMKEPVLELLSGLNKKYDSYAWWGGQVASKSVSATSLFLNIIYFFCAKRLLLEKRENIVFVVDSTALSECLLDFSKRQGCQVNDYRNKFYRWGEGLKRYGHYVAQVGSFFLKALQNRKVFLKVPRLFSTRKSQGKKRVVIRSWITRDTFSQSGGFEDRNFGRLPQWFQSKGYEVWILPMFFNLSARAMSMVCSHMKDSDQAFLIPEHYLRFSDYVKSFYNGYKVFSRQVEALKIEGSDVSPLINEALKDRGFDVPLCTLNLSGHLLKRLKEEGTIIDGFYYALECNAPENQFVLSCRKYFPDADVVGFQHTTFFPNQLAYHLGSGERESHPLPDKIVCSGLIYRDLYKKARFPEELLVDGPNLRFKSVYSYSDRAGDGENQNGDKKDLLLPLTFSYNLAFDLFMKVNEAVGDNKDYRVCIRTHPLLSKNILKDFLSKIGLDEYIFADEGVIQEWFSRTYAVISTGGSVTILEAASFGTPVIRVIPDNTIYYDPFSATDYPLEPVNTALEVRRQLQLIREIQNRGKMSFKEISKKVLNDYFTEPSEENLQVFL